MYTMQASTTKPSLENGLMQDRKNFQLWLTGADAERYEFVATLARHRQPRARDSDINRRLLGLDTEEDLLMDDEVAYFRGDITEAELMKNPRVRPILKAVAGLIAAKKK